MLRLGVPSLRSLENAGAKTASRTAPSDVETKSTLQGQQWHAMFEMGKRIKGAEQTSGWLSGAWPRKLHKRNPKSGVLGGRVEVVATALDAFSPTDRARSGGTVGLSMSRPDPLGKPLPTVGRPTEPINVTSASPTSAAHAPTSRSSSSGGSDGSFNEHSPAPTSAGSPSPATSPAISAKSILRPGSPRTPLTWRAAKMPQGKNWI